MECVEDLACALQHAVKAFGGERAFQLDLGICRGVKLSKLGEKGPETELCGKVDVVLRRVSAVGDGSVIEE